MALLVTIYFKIIFSFVENQQLSLIMHAASIHSSAFLSVCLSVGNLGMDDVLSWTLLFILPLQKKKISRSWVLISYNPNSIVAAVGAIDLRVPNVVWMQSAITAGFISSFLNRRITHLTMVLIWNILFGNWENMVVQMVEALRYKLECRGLDWNFSFT